jgi:hypothetical protein
MNPATSAAPTTSITPAPRNLRTDDSLSAELSVGIWIGGQRISGKISGPDSFARALLCMRDVGARPTASRSLL